ncbi:MAG: ATP-dependent Clp protease ATP-binding subunit, partial [Oscillospiraceae bacterium]|nr:ATP-dependent Clp protease ATP-binding subunit [Oscillospiraceae bacterium]
MQPPICSRCKKNVAVIFMTRYENGKTVNEGLCLKCAQSLGIKQVDDVMKQMGITAEDLEDMSGELMALMQQEMPEEEEDEDEIESRTATFPFLNKLFGGGEALQPQQPEEPREEAPKKRDRADKKKKFLDSYCLNLTARARNNELDRVVGRDIETERVIQILNRRQK